MNDTCMPRLIALVTRLVLKVKDGGDSTAERRDLDAMLDTIGYDSDEMLVQATHIVNALNEGQPCGWLEEYRNIYARSKGMR